MLGALLAVASGATPLVAQTGSVAEPLVDFDVGIRPLLRRYCVACHGPEKQKHEVRIDTLDPDLIHGRDAERWYQVLQMIERGDMPPEEEPQPSDAERRLMTAWLTRSLTAATQSFAREHGTVLRRLNRVQYGNTLADLLGVPIDFGAVLPDDARSKVGFTNNGEVLQASALHLDYYQAVARQALRAAIVVGERPPVTRYRVTFGRGIGRGKIAGTTGGYDSVILPTDEFTVEILDETGRPRVAADDEEQKAFDSIKRRISVGLRGSSQERFCVVENGIILYSALPHREVAPGSWQGPSPNLTLELQRCFPEQGDLVMRVTASRGFFPPARERLLVELEDSVAVAVLDPESDEVRVPPDAIVVFAAQSDERKNLELDGDTLRPKEVPKDCSARVKIHVPGDGYFQVDLVHPTAAPDAMPSVRLGLNQQTIDLRLHFDEAQRARGRVVTPLGAIAIPAGDHHLHVGGPFFVGMSQLVVTPLPGDHPLVARLTAKTDELLAAEAGKTPVIRTYVGTRTDDGMDYLTFDEPREVTARLGDSETFTFRGRLENLPIPEPESGDTEILSGILLIGLWNDNLVRSRAERGPPLLLQSIEVEAPYFPTWPPASHTAIFFASPNLDDKERYTREVLERFLTRAFRRTITTEELERYLGFWHAIKDEHPSYERGVEEVLVAALCSPNLLFLAEPVDTRPAEDLIAQEALASRLSYFLWNSPPDEVLRQVARDGRLDEQLLAQVDRLLDDDRSWRFVRAFTREWLRLDRLEQMSVDVDAFPAFTRFVKRDMAEETYQFVYRVVHDDLPIATFIDSDFAMLNQNLAGFYGIEGVSGPRFRPVAITPAQGRGGLLSQGAFLCGHSDGSQPHPIKRAVWLKSRILGEEPPPPPPNVPPLDSTAPSAANLSLRQRLEAHRQNPSCIDCHRSIDPYGVAFERYNAVGLLERQRNGTAIEANSELPDGTEVDGVDEMKAWLLGPHHDAVARALIAHLFAYALGRDVHFGDRDELDAIQEQAGADGFRMRSLLRHIVNSPSFRRP